MNIPKKVNPRYGIPLSSRPVVFGYRHASEAEENFSILEGEMADFQKQQASSISRIRVVPEKEWEINGFFIADYDGIKVVVQRFDKTRLELEKSDRDAKLAAQSDDKTLGELHATIKELAAKVSDIEARKADTANSLAISKTAKDKANEAALNESLEDAGIDIAALSIEASKPSVKEGKPDAATRAAKSKTKPKPKKTAAKSLSDS